MKKLLIVGALLFGAHWYTTNVRDAGGTKPPGAPTSAKKARQTSIVSYDRSISRYLAEGSKRLKAHQFKSQKQARDWLAKQCGATRDRDFRPMYVFLNAGQPAKGKWDPDREARTWQQLSAGGPR